MSVSAGMSRWLRGFGVRVLAIVAFVAGLGAMAANAATFTFDTQSNGSWADSIFYSADGIDLTVSGKTAQGGTAQVQTWKGYGLGVKSSGDCDSGRKKNICQGDDHQVDSSGPDDIAVFSFSQAVRITQITFNYVDSSDVFDFFVGQNGGLAKQLSAVRVDEMVTLDTDIFAKLFGIGATDGTVKQCYKTGYGRNKKTVCYDTVVPSAFKITSITVEQVPVPASAGLLSGALGALALMRRRSRRAA